MAALLAPIDVPPPAFIAHWLAFSAKAAQEYFPIRVVWEDRGAFKEGTAYVIGAPGRRLFRGGRAGRRTGAVGLRGSAPHGQVALPAAEGHGEQKVRSSSAQRPFCLNATLPCAPL